MIIRSLDYFNCADRATNCCRYRRRIDSKASKTNCRNGEFRCSLHAEGKSYHDLSPRRNMYQPGKILLKLSIVLTIIKYCAIN